MGPTEKEVEFLDHSNRIEREYSDVARDDSFSAWNLAKCHSHMIDVITISLIHFELMKTLNFRIAGKYRDCRVMVSGEECLQPDLISEHLFKWVLVYSKANTEETIKKAHVEFEKIHPFEDGNGRTGRIIMNVQRIKAGLPLIIIHEGKEQQEYYQWFKEEKQ